MAFDDTAPPKEGETCPFCEIAAAHAPFPPRSPPAALPSTLTTPESFVVLSTPTLVAFLDIMPLSPGHLLLCPRAHRPKLTSSTAAESARLGAALRVLSEALARATGVRDWNVVQNNGAAAAQVVPHLHFHVIPRPEIRASGRFSESFTMFGRGVRGELDEGEAAELAGRLREEVRAVMAGVEGDGVDDDFGVDMAKL